MADTIAILEDDLRRRDEMRQKLSQFLPGMKVRFFDNAPETIEWLHTHLDEVAIICLDHDLNAAPSQPKDPGTGRDVANYLAGRRCACSVIIHSSNQVAAPGMMRVLRDAGVPCRCISPYADLQWIEEAWLPELTGVCGRRA